METSLSRQRTVFEGFILSRGTEVVLIDCEEDRTLRAVLVGMLREMPR